MICTVETVLVTLWKLMTNIIIEYVLKANVHQKNFVHHTDYFIRERETVICEHPPPHPNPPRIVGKMWIKVKGMWKVGQKVSSRFIFMFVLSRFRGPHYLGAWTGYWSIWMLSWFAELLISDDKRYVLLSQSPNFTPWPEAPELINWWTGTDKVSWFWAG